MAKRYSRAELEYLRASPLVAKPTSLPPPEEWMGPLPDPNQKKVSTRGKNEEPQPHDGSNRRPMFERHMSRGSSNVPEDIVLGPPKTAFASAGGARNQNRTFDPSGRPSFGAQADDTARGDRQNFRDKYARQSQKHDVDVEGPQDSRAGNQQHRRVPNDAEPWSSRNSRFSGQDEGARASRRTGHREHDRDRDNIQDSRASRGLDSHRRDFSNEANDARRNGQGRGRNEPSWYQDDKDGEVFEGRRDTTRPRDWRDKTRGSTRDADLNGDRHAKQELDPEWMDEPSVPERKQAHTQEDFERWKERMKAGNGPAQENAPPNADQHRSHERTVSGISSPMGKAKVETPLVVDSSIDGFFGLWDGSGKRTNSTDDQQSKTEASKTKAAKSSKFTNFFGAKALPTEPELEQPAMNPFAAPADSSSEDKEGFQRILKLLDQQQGIPVKDGAAREQILRRNMPTSPGAQLQQQQDSSNLQNLFSPRSRNGGGPLPPNKDSEFLLNLMRQSRPQQPGQTSSSESPRQHNPIPPELLPFQNLLAPIPPILPNTMARSGEEAKPLDKLNPTPTPGDRNKGPPPGLFDSQQRPGPHDSQRMGKEGPEFAPSYISQHAPQQRQGMMPPPGFQAPLRNPAQFPPGLMGSLPSPYGMRGNPPTPGMAPPPPGFMNAPPPPGFAPLQHSHFFGGPPPRQPPPTAGEGFGEIGDFGLGQGPFRRQD